MIFPLFKIVKSFHHQYFFANIVAWFNIYKFIYLYSSFNQLSIAFKGKASVLKPNQFNHQKSYQPQKNSYYHVANAAWFRYVLCSLIHPFLVFFEVFLVVLYFIQVYQDLLVHVIQALTDIDSVVVQNFDSF